MTPQGRGRSPRKKPSRRSNALSEPRRPNFRRRPPERHEPLRIALTNVRDGERIFGIEGGSMGTSMTETEMRGVIEVFEKRSDPQVMPTIEAMKRALEETKSEDEKE